MKVVGFSGYSGSGKTTLIEQLIPALKARGQRVSVVKHAHHRFDIDQPGKDSWRHREAGAFEVVVASDRRLALVREFEATAQLSVHQLIAELDAGVDWVLVEGFRHGDLPKLEIWRAAAVGKSGQPHPVRYPEDGQICAVVTDVPAALPLATNLPILGLDDAPGVARWLLDHAGCFDYKVEPHD
ncbi:MAG: molybdopterin-guanine dinucleotide biosynthesis protein B [Variovorax sp.]